jgi:hypothetical protein
MSKPKTTYNTNSSAAAITAGSLVVLASSLTILATGYTTFPSPTQLENKPKVTYGVVAKLKTTFGRGDGDTATTWALNSTTVTLNSLLAYLNGYFTPAAPTQLGSKPRTTFAEF